MRAIYEDGTYLRNNPTWHEEESAWKANLVARMLSKHHLHPATVCDVGCGAGGILQWLADNSADGATYYGYEVSPQAYDICRKKESDRLHFFLGDVLQEEDRVFDVALALDVLEHVEDYLGFLRGLKRKAAHTVLHIPLDLCVQWALLSRPFLHVRSSVGHLHYLNKDTAFATLKDTGFEVVDWFYTGVVTEFPSRDWKGEVMRRARQALFSVHRDLTVRILGGYSMLVLAR